MSPEPRVIFGISCLLSLSCQSFVGDYTPDLEDGPNAIDSAPLCSIESEAYVLRLELDSMSAQATLEGYYEAANPELVSHLVSVADDFRMGVPHARATYLRGAAGVGKSFVTRNITDAFTETEQCTIEFADLFALDEASLGFAVERAPDLATLDGGTVFNELPKISVPESFRLEQLLEAGGCLVDGEVLPLVVLDGIDELHDTTSTQILEAVDDFLLARDEAAGFVHFLISGRPEGFGTWLTAPERSEDNQNIVDQFDLEPPHYRTAGDLAYRVRGYLEFARDPPPEPEEVEAHVASFTDAVSTYPFLTYSIGNLAVGNIVIEQTAPELEFSERSLKEGIFDDILLRNVGTHARPGADSALEGPYRRLLEDIAARYAEVDAEGRFSVRSEDTVEVFDDAGSSLGRVRVRNALGRSGVAFLTDPGTKTTRYRFDPFWLHAHLLERRNERLGPTYEYRTCD